MRKEDVAKLLSKSVDLSEEEIFRLLEKPKYSNLGDIAFPCFTLAAKYSKSPFAISQEIASRFEIAPQGFSKVISVGGYVNFFYDNSMVSQEILTKILKEKKSFGKSKDKKKRMIEFSQPNTHKAFHVGHIRGTSLGESLARIMEFSGNKLIRANYSGDTGMHIAKWIWCYQKFHRNEKLNQDESWIAGIYVDAVKRLVENEALQEEVDVINRKIESKEDRSINALWKKTRAMSIRSWNKIYKELGTKFDVHYFESEVESEAKKLAQDLLEKGIAEKSEEAVIMDLKKYDLGVWILLRRDGTVLYSAKDLALARRKTKDYALDSYLTIIADEQRLHFQQLVKTLELTRFEKRDSYKFMTYGMVRLPTGKMSSRTGDNILYSSFIDELIAHSKEEIKKRDNKIPKDKLEKRALLISIAAIKYSMLKQDSNKNIIFDKEQELNFEGDSGPYLLYSYARASSIIKKAKSRPKSVKIEKINDDEAELVKKLSEFPEIVNSAYNQLNTSLIANYSFQLCQMFNEFYHSSPVLNAQKDVKSARLAMVEAFRIVLKSSLNLLGIEVIEEM